MQRAVVKSQIEENMTGWWKHSVSQMEKKAWKDECAMCLHWKPNSPGLTQCALAHFPMARCTLSEIIYPECNVFGGFSFSRQIR